MKLLYFAWLREKIGLAQEDVDLPAGVDDVGALVRWLQGRGQGYAAAFDDTKLVRCAIDQEFAQADARLAGAAEIAFFPPVTGG